MQRDADLRMRSLEERLANSLSGGARTYRNPALDILTGRTAEHRVDSTLAVNRSSLAVALQPTPVLRRDPAAIIDARARFRIERPAPHRRSRITPIVRIGLVLALTALGFVGGHFWQASMLPDTAAQLPPSALPTVVPTLPLVAEPVAPRLAAGDAPTSVPAMAPAPAPANAPVASPANATAAPRTASVAAPANAALAAPASATKAAPASELRVLLDQRFAPATRAWSDPQATVSSSDGAYRMRASQAQRFVAIGVPGTDNLADATVTASMRKIGGPGGGGYGLIIRDQAPGPRDGFNQNGRFYVFEVGDRGELGVWLRDEDRWVDLMPWTLSDVVNPGTAANELTVSAVGDQMSFFVNGIPVASQVDNLLHTGAIALFTGGDNNEVALDHITIRVPR